MVTPLHVSRHNEEMEVHSIHQDSREVEENSVFIAIRGNEVDGHMFIEDAIDRGAKVLICEESFYTETDEVCVMEVEDTRNLVGTLAQEFAGNPAKDLTIVGITGTNGKTTTATLVYQVLSAAGKKASLLGTVSKRILGQETGSSLTTSDPIELARDMQAMVESGSDYLVMEVSSHALDQSRVSGIDFAVAAFTNLSHDHLDYHSTVEEYAKAKKKLFDTLPAGSTAVINADDPNGAYMLSDCEAETIPFSFDTEQNFILSNTPAGLTITVQGTTIQSPLVGTFNAYNVAEAFLICKSLGLDPDDIVQALRVCEGASGRMQTIQVEGRDLPLVIVDYAHTPDALENVLSTLKDLKETDQQLIVIFGAGGDRDSTKRPQMAKAAEKFADRIVVSSDNPRFENPDVIIADILDGFESLTNVSSITDRREAIQTTISESNSDDIILIAGKGHEDYQDVKGTKHSFDDRRIAREALELKAKGGN